VKIANEVPPPPIRHRTSDGESVLSFVSLLTQQGHSHALALASDYQQTVRCTLTPMTLHRAFREMIFMSFLVTSGPKAASKDNRAANSGNEKNPK
jgi:hypothetical protein